VVVKVRKCLALAVRFLPAKCKMAGRIRQRRRRYESDLQRMMGKPTSFSRRVTYDLILFEIKCTENISLLRYVYPILHYFKQSKCYPTVISQIEKLKTRKNFALQRNQHLKECE